MKSIQRVLRVYALVPALLLLVAAGSAVLAQADPDSVIGAGQGRSTTNLAGVTYEGGIVYVPSINTVGNEFAFSFFAERDKNGMVQGEMQFWDHTTGMHITSNVVSLSLHPTIQRPVGGVGILVNVSSDTTSVVVDREAKPGWRFANAPFHDTGEDLKGAGDGVCFELFDDKGVRLFQWQSPLTFGDIQVK